MVMGDDELPILWVPGCVVLPAQTVDVVLHGRGRARALWTAEEDARGQLVVAPGAFPPRKASELPPFLCVARIRPGAEEGRRLQGVDRVRIEKVGRSGRGRFARVEYVYDEPWEHAHDVAEPLRTALEQLQQLRNARLPLAYQFDGWGPELLPWVIASVLPLTVEQRLSLLAERAPAVRLERVLALVQAEIDVALLERQILQVADD